MRGKLIYKILVAVMAISLQGLQVTAQSWNLQQCIDHALSHNLQVKQSELNNKIGSNAVLQSKAEVLPTLNGSASHSYSFGRTVDPFTNTFITDRVRSNSFSVSSSVTLFNGFQTLQNIRKSEFDYRAGMADTEKLRNDMTLSVINAYMQVLFSEELVQTSIDQERLSGQQLERIRHMVEAGALARGNQLDMEAQLALDELQVVQARNQLEIARLNLAQLLEIESAENFTVERPSLEVPSVAPMLEDAQSLYGKALSVQPQIEATEWRMLSAGKSLAMARGAQSPSLGLRASYGSGYSDARQTIKDVVLTGVDSIGYTSGGQTVYTPSYDAVYETTPFSDQIDQNVNRAVGFYLSIPIFNGLRTRTAISNARVALENAKLSQQMAKNQLRKEVQQAIADTRAAFNQYQASLKSARALEESFRYTDLKATQGLVNSVIYIEAKNRLAKSKSDLLQAKYDYFFKLKILDYYAGNPLTF